MKLAAIWLNKPVKIGGVITNRLAPGDFIRVENDKLVDSGMTTHQVTAVRGGISNIDSEFIAICVEHMTYDTYILKL